VLKFRREALAPPALLVCVSVGVGLVCDLLACAYMHGYPSPMMGIASALEKLVGLYSSAAVSSM
jgi:hypothetical protein